MRIQTNKGSKIISFNPIPSKQVEEVIFTRQIKENCTFTNFMNGNTAQHFLSQKHLGLILDT